MLNRNARLRREYLYRKSLEGKERVAYERKRKIREALAGMVQENSVFVDGGQHTGAVHDTIAALHTEGKPIPSELRNEEAQLRNEIELEDDNTAVPRNHIDDEYAHAGEVDPRVLITTSRDPSSRLSQFAKELKVLVPNSQRLNRGNQVCCNSTRGVVGDKPAHVILCCCCC